MESYLKFVIQYHCMRELSLKEMSNFLVLKAAKSLLETSESWVKSIINGSVIRALVIE